MHHLLQSFRHGAWALRRSPGFSASVIASLALGIGASVAVFAVVNAVLLSPLPYADAGRLVAIFLREPQNQSSRNPTSARDFRVSREAGSIDAMTAATPWAPVMTGMNEPDQLHGLKASSSLFDLLGVDPMLGRTFSAAAESAAEEQVVVLGHALWQRRFGGDPSIIGRSEGAPSTAAS